MPVSGVVVTCIEGSAGQVAETISAIDGVEVQAVLPDGQIVAVIEHDTVDGEVGLVSDLHGIDGVVTVRMAYHNFEDVC